MFSLVPGTRPEIIKLSPIIRECESRNIPYFTLHTGQHYSYEMDRIFFEELELPQPKFNLDVGSGLHGEQTGKILEGVEKVLIQEKPDVVLVQGDTNTVMAGALAAAKLHIPVAHVEAGLRSFDRRMPEEINRVIADHVSDFLFAPTKTAWRYLEDEGIPDEKIHVTGNTVVDAVFQNLEIAKKRHRISPGLEDVERGEKNQLVSSGPEDREIGENQRGFSGLEELERGEMKQSVSFSAENLKRREMKQRVSFRFEDLEKGQYILVTAHRAENVDVKKNLAGILAGLDGVHRETGLPIIFPIHPRTEKMMTHFNLTAPSITLTKPLGYLEFLRLESNAKLIITDSGGLQEEACILGVPCVTLRENTERPETLDVGSNVLAGTDARTILEKSRIMLDKKPGWKNPYGDGHAARRMVDVLVEAGLGK